ncbi:MAG: protein-glutamate O-methyltransferase CheR [Opitutaceae bacterium]|nr:protein-glutamate O-methyltransferase CheR [Opitutaceae bacterium]
MRASDYEFIRHLVYERSRIDLGPDKRELVSARLGKRVRATRFASIADYCLFLRSEAPEDEVANLIDAVSTNHTYFFRESSHFDFLRTVALPDLAGRRRQTYWPQLRLWSAACSSGEEPYSLAIVLAEALPALAADWSWRIEATDISRRVLAQAQAAIYDEKAVSRMPPDIIQRYFQRGYGPQEGNYRAKRFLQERVFFAQLNLVGDALPFSEPFQVIFCRNVMIYFDRPTQEELVHRLARQLVPGGYLFVGHSESLTGVRHPLQSVHPAVYRRPPAARP